MPTLIHRGEAWQYQWRVLQPDQYVPNESTPLDATATIRAWLSATFKGSAIAPSTVSLVRGDEGLRVDGREYWSGILDATDVTTTLSGTATGNPIYEVLEINGERKCQQLQVAD